MNIFARVGSVGTCAGAPTVGFFVVRLSPDSSLTEVLRGTIACGAR